ncbi:hypothetical protein C7B77_19055 [Chamaesiphon polymorphus CCALA 037]|uniref:Uncharacterized protein n=1 Tax=Chamaesiphon polymorphus CCALA 037 TaxID=2107692 RepID=A0A2T1GA08_9CYAN|nr:hypothetical protein C7B77_19055 [Chamaesiphon polymorphus CCALA 037]
MPRSSCWQKCSIFSHSLPIFKSACSTVAKIRSSTTGREPSNFALIFAANFKPSAEARSNLGLFELTLSLLRYFRDVLPTPKFILPSACNS